MKRKEKRNRAAAAPVPVPKAPWMCVTSARREIRAIGNLPFVQRVTHHKARRTVGVVGIGVSMMVGGTVIASHRHELAHHVPFMSHYLFDTIGYFIHAAGALPALRYIEPFWLLMFGEEVAK